MTQDRNVDDKAETRMAHMLYTAAALDGVGTTGVAPDAIFGYKIAWDSSIMSFSSTEAIVWSVNNGADVINMSGGVNFDGLRYCVKR